jgi:ribose 5-phosphate isomerase B
MSSTIKLAIGADISGFDLKEAVRGFLDSLGIEYVDFGTKNAEEPVDYYDIVPGVVKAIQNGEFCFGILFCGSGMGMAQIANSYKGIRAAVCESVYASKMCRAINDSNILCMGGFIVGPQMGCEMTKVFLNTKITEDLDEYHDFLLNAQEEIKKLEEVIY